MTWVHKILSKSIGISIIKDTQVMSLTHISSYLFDLTHSFMLNFFFFFDTIPVSIFTLLFSDSIFVFGLNNAKDFPQDDTHVEHNRRDYYAYHYSTNVILEFVESFLSIEV